MTFTSQEVLDQFNAEVAQKRVWLETFSKGPKKWPDNEIAKKARELELYTYLAERQSAAINARKPA